jgi:Flp pilus assembly protein TadG
MMISRKNHRRSGAAVLESAIVLPVLLLLLIGTLAGAAMVFTYQEVATLAREGSRYACVHGTRYAADTDKPPANAQEIYDKGIAPRMMTVDPSFLTYTVTWDTDKRPGSYVTVRVDYVYSNVIFGTVNLTSTSTVQMMW